MSHDRDNCLMAILPPPVWFKGKRFGAEIHKKIQVEVITATFHVSLNKTTKHRLLLHALHQRTVVLKKYTSCAMFSFADIRSQILRDDYRNIVENLTAFDRRALAHEEAPPLGLCRRVSRLSGAIRESHFTRGVKATIIPLL